MFTFSIADLFSHVKTSHTQSAAAPSVEWYGYVWRGHYTGEWIVLEFISANERGDVRVKMLCGNGTVREWGLPADELQWQKLDRWQVADLRNRGLLP